MIAAWMIYATLVGAVLLAGAVGLARLARTTGRAERWIWTGALSAALALPVLQPILRSLPDRPPAPGAPGAVVGPLLGLPTVIPVDAVAPSLRLGPLLLFAWVLLSLLQIGGLLLGAVRLRAGFRKPGLPGRHLPIRRTWNLGPAVSGVIRPVILLPAWFRELSARERRWVLRHEAEHLRARDPVLHRFGVLARILVPWNPAIHLLARGLSRALETDCDRRVLQGTRASSTPAASTRSYGEALLRVAARRSGPAPALGTVNPGITSLEHRIRTMTTPRRRWTPLRIAAAAILAPAAVLVACDVPSPTVELDTEAAIGAQEYVAEADLGAQAGAGDPTFTPYTQRPEILNREEVIAALQTEYRQDLRDAGLEGQTNVWFFIDREGRVTDTRIQQSSGHADLDEAALRVAAAMRFSPALNRDEPVPVWVAFPISFRMRAEDDGR